MSPDCLLGVVPQPTDSRLSETRTKPERIHDAKSEWRGIEGNNCGDVYTFAVGPYSYRKTRLGVGIATEI